MKKQRQAAIVKAVSTGGVTSQAELARILESQGFRASQTTISRDLSELGLGKLSHGGRAVYVSGQPVPGGVSDAEYRRLAPQMLLSAESTGNMVVLRTSPGNAPGLAAALDVAAMKGIAGTVAGDDTIVVVCSNGTTSASMRKKLMSYTVGKVR